MPFNAPKKYRVVTILYSTLLPNEIKVTNESILLGLTCKYYTQGLDTHASYVNYKGKIIKNCHNQIHVS